MQEKIEAIAQEFIEHGEFNNTLSILKSYAKAHDCLLRHDACMAEFIRGLKLALKTQIDQERF